MHNWRLIFFVSSLSLLLHTLMLINSHRAKEHYLLFHIGDKGCARENILKIITTVQ